MKTKTLIGALLLSTVAVAGLGALLLWDDGPKTGAGPSAEGKKSPARSGDALQEMAPPGSPPPPAGSAGIGLSPKEEQALRAALEAIARDAEVRGTLTTGVDQPWPLPASQEVFKSCLEGLKWTTSGDGANAKEQTCSCATRSVQQLYPKDPPKPGTRNANQAYERSIREQIERCATQ